MKIGNFRFPSIFLSHGFTKILALFPVMLKCYFFHLGVTKNYKAIIWDSQTISMGKSINSILREQLLLVKTMKTVQNPVEKLGVLQHLRLSCNNCYQLEAVKQYHKNFHLRCCLSLKFRIYVPLNIIFIDIFLASNIFNFTELLLIAHERGSSFDYAKYLCKINVWNDKLSLLSIFLEISKNALTQ